MARGQWNGNQGEVRRSGRIAAKEHVSYSDFFTTRRPRKNQKNTSDSERVLVKVTVVEVTASNDDSGSNQPRQRRAVSVVAETAVIPTATKKRGSARALAESAPSPTVSNKRSPIDAPSPRTSKGRAVKKQQTTATSKKGGGKNSTSPAGCKKNTAVSSAVSKKDSKENLASPTVSEKTVTRSSSRRATSKKKVAEPVPSPTLTRRGARKTVTTVSSECITPGSSPLAVVNKKSTTSASPLTVTKRSAAKTAPAPTKSKEGPVLVDSPAIIGNSSSSSVSSPDVDRPSTAPKWKRVLAVQPFKLMAANTTCATYDQKVCASEVERCSTSILSVNNDVIILDDTEEVNVGCCDFKRATTQQSVKVQKHESKITVDDFDYAEGNAGTLGTKHNRVQVRESSVFFTCESRDYHAATDFFSTAQGRKELEKSDLGLGKLANIIKEIGNGSLRNEHDVTIAMQAVADVSEQERRDLVEFVAPFDSPSRTLNNESANDLCDDTVMSHQTTTRYGRVVKPTVLRTVLVPFIAEPLDDSHSEEEDDDVPPRKSPRLTNGARRSGRRRGSDEITPREQRQAAALSRMILKSRTPWSLNSTAQTLESTSLSSFDDPQRAASLLSTTMESIERVQDQNTYRVLGPLEEEDDDW